jgi:class 3 adenylate cyclase
VHVAPHRAHVALLATDLKGFSAVRESNEPEVELGLLGAYHAAVGGVASANSGNVMNFFGDGMLIVFNYPTSIPDPEQRAVKAALEMRNEVNVLVAAWKKQGHSLGLRIGFDAGFATIGQIGFPGRYEIGVLGRAVTNAWLLSEAGADGQILATQRFASGLDDDIELRPCGKSTLPGHMRAIAVVEIVGPRAP